MTATATGYDVWTWPGWGAISAWASILALVTVIIGLWQFLNQRRQVPTVWLAWKPYGTQARDHELFHVFEFHNAGRGSGHLDVLELVGAHAVLEDGYVAPSILGPGQTFRLLITAPSLNGAWVRTMIRTSDDFRRVIFDWQPLVDGDLSEVRQGQVQRWYRRSLLQRWWDRVDPREVSPHGQPTASWRISRRPSGVERHARLVKAVFGETRHPLRSSGIAGGNPGDLPYAGPPVSD